MQIFNFLTLHSWMQYITCIIPFALSAAGTALNSYCRCHHNLMYESLSILKFWKYCPGIDRRPILLHLHLGLPFISYKNLFIRGNGDLYEFLYFFAWWFLSSVKSFLVNLSLNVYQLCRGFINELIIVYSDQYSLYVIMVSV